MPVYFVYRSHYEGPTGKFVRRFDDPSVLAWFQNRWRGVTEPGESRAYAEGVIGCNVYGFSSLFDAIAEYGLAPPATARELAAILDEHLYVEGEVRCQPRRRHQGGVGARVGRRLLRHNIQQPLRRQRQAWVLIAFQRERDPPHARFRSERLAQRGEAVGHA